MSDETVAMVRHHMIELDTIAVEGFEMTRVGSLALKFVVVIVSSLLLLQIEVGWYGIWVNWGLLSAVTVASFILGLWGME